MNLSVASAALVMPEVLEHCPAFFLQDYIIAEFLFSLFLFPARLCRLLCYFFAALR